MWHEQYVKRINRAVQRSTLRKLELIHAARDVEGLRIPPGNRLKRLVGDRRGQHIMRVNAQWCLCFIWREGMCRRCRTRRLPLKTTGSSRSIRGRS